MKIIKLPYTPSITSDKLVEILKKEYPDKRINKGVLNTVRIGKNALRIAQISVNHNEKRGFTQIAVNATYPLWVIATIPALPVFVVLSTYCQCGNWATEINNKLNQVLK